MTHTASQHVAVPPPALDPVYTYDLAGNRLTMTDPTGTTTYASDALNRLTSVGRPGSLVSFTYDALSRRAQTTFPNGTEAVLAYDAASQLLSQVHRLTSLPATLLAQAASTYDPVGNRETLRLSPAP